MQVMVNLLWSSFSDALKRPLFISRIVTLARSRDQPAIVSLIDHHAYRMKASVAPVVVGVVADHVLRAKVFGDLRGDGGHFAQFRGEEGPPAGIFGQSDQ